MFATHRLLILLYLALRMKIEKFFASSSEMSTEPKLFSFNDKFL